MEAVTKYLKLGFIVVFFGVLTFGNISCAQQKCAANGGDQPKKVNKYTKKKPQSGLWGKETKRRRR